MPKPSPISPAYILSILERLHPNGLLLARSDTGLDEATLQLLWRKLAFSFDPVRRITTVEFLLLIMDEARTRDAKAYLTKVFLPWIGIQRRLKDQMLRILADIERINVSEAYGTEDTAHIATKIYRPLVADVFDPYLTLIVATYEFIEDKFISIEATNVGALERAKTEWIQSRIRRSGGPDNLLDGYDPIVRNAVSHAGSEGVQYDKGSVLFRDIKRGPTPEIKARRWSYEELDWHVIALIELVMGIDAAVEIFGIDNMDVLVSDKSIKDLVLLHAYDKEGRRKLAKGLQSDLEPLRVAKNVPQQEKLNLLGQYLFQACAERDIPCTSVGFNAEGSACFVSVPVEAKPETDDEVRNQAAKLIRYAIIARSIFSTMFDQFIIEGQVGEATPIRIRLAGGSLDEYANEEAGLFDLIGDAELKMDGDIIRLEIDQNALEALEDISLGPRMPRRGRSGD